MFVDFPTASTELPLAGSLYLAAIFFDRLFDTVYRLLVSACVGSVPALSAGRVSVVELGLGLYCFTLTAVLALALLLSS